MDYREYAVPRTLQRHIRCVWHLRDPAPSQAAQTLYPDGHCELIVHRGHPMRAFHPEQGWHQQTKSLFAAQHRSPVRLAATGPLDCIGVRLQPAVSAALPETALPTLRDHIVDLATLNADFSDRFVTACTQAGDKDEALSALWALLDRLFDFSG